MATGRKREWDYRGKMLLVDGDLTMEKHEIIKKNPLSHLNDCQRTSVIKPIRLNKINLFTKPNYYIYNKITNDKQNIIIIFIHFNNTLKILSIKV